MNIRSISECNPQRHGETANKITVNTNMGPTLLRKTILEGMDNDIIQFLFNVIIIACPCVVCGFVITYTMKIPVKLTHGQIITFH